MALPLSTKTAELRRRDRKYIGRGDTPATHLEIVRAEGSYVWDASGRRFVDFTMGWCCGNLGWGVPAIRERLTGFAGPEYVPRPPCTRRRSSSRRCSPS